MENYLHIHIASYEKYRGEKPRSVFYIYFFQYVKRIMLDVFQFMPPKITKYDNNFSRKS